MIVVPLIWQSTKLINFERKYNIFASSLEARIGYCLVPVIGNLLKTPIKVAFIINSLIMTRFWPGDVKPNDPTKHISPLQRCVKVEMILSAIGFFLNVFLSGAEYFLFGFINIWYVLRKPNTNPCTLSRSVLVGHCMKSSSLLFRTVRRAIRK